MPSSVQPLVRLLDLVMADVLVHSMVAVWASMWVGDLDQATAEETEQHLAVS